MFWEGFFVDLAASEEGLVDLVPEEVVEKDPESSLQVVNGEEGQFSLLVGPFELGFGVEGNQTG